MEKTLMAEDTTTDELVDVNGTGAGVHEGILVDADGNALTAEQVQALPDQSTEDTAALADDSNSTEQVRSEAISDEDITADPNVAWAMKSKGIDPSDPNALAKLAKIARDNQRDFTKDRQAQSELDRTVGLLDGIQAPGYQVPQVGNQWQQPAYDPQYDPNYDPNAQYAYQPPIAPQVPQLDVNSNKMNLVMFTSRHATDIPSGSELDQEIGKVINEDPLFWTSSPQHLERALKLAKANMAEGDIEARIEQARQEERDRLTRKSSLQSPATQSVAKSTGPALSTAADAERFLATASKTEIADNRDKLEQLLGVELGPR